MGFQLPVGDVPISASWQDHKNRNPPSTEPGTDYACAYGSLIIAVDSGYITYVKTSTSGAMGRVIEYRTDSGGDTRTIHCAEVWMSTGQRISAGQGIGISGASGYGSEWYYGPHAHQTLWPGIAWQADTIDFQKSVGGGGKPPAPPTITMGEDDSMWLIWYGDNGPAEGWLLCPTAQVGVTSERDYELLKRIIVSDQSAAHPVGFNFAERDIINNYLRQLAATTAQNAQLVGGLTDG